MLVTSEICMFHRPTLLDLTVHKMLSGNTTTLQFWVIS